MLDTLRRIVQDVNNAKDLDHALQLIVNRVKEAMGVDLCSVYLTDRIRQQHILMATNGLNPESVREVRLDFGEGLVGLVGVKEEVVNLADGASHPNFKYIPQTGEEVFHAFLGVPIIHHRKHLGVLVLQRHAREKFDEDIVTFLITVAAQLAGAIAHAEASGGIDILQQGSRRSAEPFQGQPGAQGIGVGVAFILYAAAELSSIPDRRVEDSEAELAVFKRAVAAVKVDITNMISSWASSLPAEDKALFDAYLLMLESDTLIGGVENRIRQGNWASGALRDTIAEHLRVFEEMEDPYLRERGADVRDLGRRILLRLQSGGEKKPRNYPDKTVLVGEEITASMLAEVPVEKIAGVVSVAGSRTSHVAILARAMGVPAVMGADFPVARIDGKDIIVDGYRGQVFIDPTKAILDEFRKRKNSPPIWRPWRRYPR